MSYETIRFKKNAASQCLFQNKKLTINQLWRSAFVFILVNHVESVEPTLVLNIKLHFAKGISVFEILLVSYYLVCIIFLL